MTDLKKEIQKILHPLESLTPPRAPILSDHDQKIMREMIPKADLIIYDDPIVSETSVEDMSDFEKVSPQQTGSTPAIDFEARSPQLTGAGSPLTGSKPPKCEHRATYNDSRCVRCGEKVIKPPNTKAIVSEKSITMVDGATDKGHKPSKEVLDSTPAIDFEAMAKASEFQRFVYWILTGETFRGSTKALRMKINHVKQKINMVQSMPPEVMRELKEVLRKRNEKIL